MLTSSHGRYNAMLSISCHFVGWDLYMMIILMDILLSMLTSMLMSMLFSMLIDISMSMVFNSLNTSNFTQSGLVLHFVDILPRCRAKL